MAVAGLALISSVSAKAQPPGVDVLDFGRGESYIETGATARDLGVEGNKPRTVEAWVYTREFQGGGVFSLGTTERGEFRGNRDFSLRTLREQAAVKRLARYQKADFSIVRDQDWWRVNLWGSIKQDINFSYPSHERWVHLAVVHTGSKSIVYADGEEVARASRELDTHPDEEPFRIGRWRDHDFSGKIAEVGVWNRALSKEEVRKHREVSLGGDEDGLVGYWPLNEGEGEIVNDFAQDNHGRLMGAVEWNLNQPFVSDLAAEKRVEPGQAITLGPVKIARPRGEASFQWYFEGQAIEGATRNSFQLTDIEPADLGTYYITVDDERESTPVESTHLTVKPEADSPAAKEIALDSESTRVRKIAVEALTDQEVLSQVALQSEHATIRKIAIEKLEPESPKLSEIALTDASAQVRQIAARKISDQDVLIQIATEDEREAVRAAAAEKLATGSAALEEIALHDDSARVRTIALAGVTDEGILNKIAREDDDAGVRAAALKKAFDRNGLPLVPWPESLKPGDGRFVLEDDARIAASSKELEPLTQVLAGEIEALFDRPTPIAEGGTRPGDIVLRIDPELEEEAYRLRINDRVRITGGSYAGVAAGTVTFLQAVTGNEENRLGLPVMQVEDAPHADYRGLMLDPARDFIPPKMLKKAIDLCRWYKVRYLHLHLTDNESFTFPSQAYPQLPTPDRHYTLEQLRELERYAVKRGVVIVPELDVPGHAGAMVDAMPKWFEGNGGTINFANPDVREVVDTLIGEMCEVFRATPYFHIGGDEISFGGLAADPYFKKAMNKLGIDDVREIYRDFLVHCNETVKSHGKRTIVWEGFEPNGRIHIPRDILVMAFQGGEHYLPDHLVEDGYTVINTSGKPLYIARSPYYPVDVIYDWNMYSFEHGREYRPAYTPIQVARDASVLGAQTCSWNNNAASVISTARKRLAAMSERLWNPDLRHDFQDFSKRLRQTDSRLDKLLETEEK